MKKCFLSVCILLILLSFSLFSSEEKIQYKDVSHGNAAGNNISFSFESFDMPGWYIGVKDEDAFLFSINIPIEKEYTTFNIVPGIADGKAVSIQAATDVNYYLRRQEQIIKLKEYSTWDMYKQNTTFIIDQGLADKNNQNLVSFRSWKYPQMYIRHKNRNLFIEHFDGSEFFKSNATFIVKPPNWDGTNRLTKERTGEKSFSSSNEASFAAFIFYISLVIITLVIVFINQSKNNGNTKLRYKTG